MMNDLTMEEEEKDAPQSPYMLFLLVLVFFITGLLGFLICHVLKKKGYRCRTSPEELDPEINEALREDQDTIDDISNEDTVERIVKCIIQNEANAEALKQMLGDTEGDMPIVPGLCPHRDSQDAGPPHHHTVHLGSTQAPCIHCTRKKQSLLHRMGRSKEGRGKSHPGEVTVFSVGRFRVTHIGKKHSIQGSQDETNVSSEPVSLYKDPEEQREKKTQNGITAQDFYEHKTPQNGPEVVGLTKLEFERDAKIKGVDNNGVKKMEFRNQKIFVKNKGAKERRSSAPEHTAARKQSGDLIEMKKVECPEKKSIAKDK